MILQAPLPGGCGPRQRPCILSAWASPLCAPGRILSGRLAVIVKVVTGFHGAAKRGLVRVEPGWWRVPGGPVCMGPPAHLCSVDLAQRWLTCPTWVLLSRLVGRLRTPLTGAALQSASQVVSLPRKGAKEARCGRTSSSGPWFLALCSNTSYLKRGFLPRLNMRQESKGGGWRSFSLQCHTCQWLPWP